MTSSSSQPSLRQIEEMIDAPLEMLSKKSFKDKISEQNGYLVEKEEIVGFRFESYKMDLDYIDFDILTAFGEIKYLNLRSIHPADWSILKKFSSLTWLRWTHALLEFHDIDFLRHLTRLRYLDLSHNDLINISGLYPLKNLRELDLSDNQLHQNDSDRYIYNLTHALQDLEDFSSKDTDDPLYNEQEKNELKAQMTGDLEKAERTGLCVLNELEKLQILNLAGNELFTVSLLDNLNELTKIDISNNYIIELDSLTKMKKLTHVNASNNELKSIKALKKLKYLKYLDIRNNGLENIRGFDHCKVRI